MRPLAKVVERHAPDVDAAASRWIRAQSAELCPEHAPRDHDAITVCNRVRDIEAQIRERRARRHEALLEFVARERGTLP
jgi:hypothetical protein